MLKILALCLLIIYTISAYSQVQQHHLKGKVKDISTNVDLHNTSVVLLDAKNNFIIKDTRTNFEGSFEIKNIASGEYTLLFTRPGYVDFSQKINFDEKNLNIDLNGIELYKKDILLKEVVIKAQVSAIKIIGDTVEFKADSFKVQPNASVEDLLKQLPSIQIDQNGKITAQGKVVKKVLVDGEEFFGNDPLLVTRNLRADMIDKVQVYDKKSDAAEFTGINDGIKDKTINLKLKESKKQGYFGKASAGVGNKKFYNGQGMVNLFQGNRKLAAYLTTGNIGQSGLAKEDKERIDSDEEGNGNYNGKGVPKITSAGLHYDDKWDENKKTINANAKIYSSNVDEKSSTISETELIDGLLKTNSQYQNNSMQLSNKYNFTYKDKYNKTSTFKVYSDFTYQTNKNESNSNSQNSNANYLIMDYEKYNKSDNAFNVFNLNLEWQKKFKKEGRTISTYLNSNFYDTNLLSKSNEVSTNYNALGGITNVDNLLLDKDYTANNKTLSLNTVYTEKLSKGLSLSLNYFLYRNKLKQNGQSFNDESHQTLNEEYSANNILDDTNNKLGATFNYNYKKLFIDFGSGFSYDQFKINDVNNNFILNRNYDMWSPRANLNYKFTDYSNLELTYTGNTNKPRPTQLLPLQYDNGLTYKTLPNFDLQSSFSNKFNLVYSRYWVASQTYFSASSGYTNTDKPVITSIDISPTAFYTYRSENLLDKATSNFSFNVVYGSKIKSVNTSFYVGANSNLGKSYSKSQGVLNELNTNTHSTFFQLIKTKEKRYNASLYSSFIYYQNKFSLQGNKVNYFANYTGSSIDVYLNKVQLHTDGNYQWQQKTDARGKNFQTFIWNAWVGKNFFKKDDLLIKIACNDILNQNIGYSRTASNNSYSENTFNTIQRFFLLSAVWNFNKFTNKPIDK